MLCGCIADEDEVDNKYEPLLIGRSSAESKSARGESPLRSLGSVPEPWPLPWAGGGELSPSPNSAPSVAGSVSDGDRLPSRLPAALSGEDAVAPELLPDVELEFEFKLESLLELDAACCAVAAARIASACSRDSCCGPRETMLIRL